MTIPTHLIECALNLTGKKMNDVSDSYFDYGIGDWRNIFSIEDFCYYLLSKEFLTKQNAVIHGALHKFALGIHKFQRKDEEFPNGNPEPLISLLEKIPGN